MSKRMDWRKARKFNGTEEKYEHGTVLKNGRIVHTVRDSLARRALRAEQAWLKAREEHKRKHHKRKKGKTQPDWDYLRRLHGFER